MAYFVFSATEKKDQIGATCHFIVFILFIHDIIYNNTFYMCMYVCMQTVHNVLSYAFLQARSLAEVGRTGEAIECLKNATLQFPTSVAPFKHLASLLARQTNFKEVIYV